MSTQTITADGVRFNPRPGRLVRALHRLLPRVFGRPVFVLELRGPNGRLKARRRVWNTVTTSGKNGTMDQILAAPTLAKPTHMAVGTGSPAANALGTELDRNALTSKTRSSATVTFVGDWAAGDATGALTEAGVFDASSAGNAWLTVSFAVVNKGAADTLQISWTYAGT